MQRVRGENIRSRDCIDHPHPRHGAGGPLLHVGTEGIDPYHRSSGREAPDVNLKHLWDGNPQKVLHRMVFVVVEHDLLQTRKPPARKSEAEEVRADGLVRSRPLDEHSHDDRAVVCFEHLQSVISCCTRVYLSLRPRGWPSTGTTSAPKVPANGSLRRGIPKVFGCTAGSQKGTRRCRRL